MSIQASIERAIGHIRDRTFTNSDDRLYFVWKNTEIPCIRTNVADGSTVVVGRVERLVSAVIFVKKEDMPFVTADMTTITVDSDEITADAAYGDPLPGQKPSVGARTYKIAFVRDQPSHFEFVCVDANSGR